MKNLKKKAFTLVELLVVIAIIAILAVAGVVGYVVFTKKAQQSNDTSLVSQLNEYMAAAGSTDSINTVSDETYASFTEEQQAKFDQSIGSIAKYSDDPELQAVASKLTYSAGEITMTSTSNSKYEAIWDLAKGTITGKKK